MYEQVRYMDLLKNKIFKGKISIKMREYIISKDYFNSMLD